MRNLKQLPLRIGVGIVLLNHQNKVFVGKRIDNPQNFWQMPQGGVDENEDFLQAAKRELKEETGLDGNAARVLGVCSHFNTMFGDILLIGIEVEIKDWSTMVAGDDAEEADLFSLNSLPGLAFPCHEKIVNMYRERIK